MSRPSSQAETTLASSPGWLKLIACAAPWMTTTVTCAGDVRATSTTRGGPGISGSRLPSTASVGTGVCCSRSSDGKRVSWWNSRSALTGPNRR